LSSRKQGNGWHFLPADCRKPPCFTPRGATALTDHLGNSFAGVVNCDRAKMYYSVKRLQWCWAHLKRDFQALIDTSDHQATRLGHDLMRETRALFRLWARSRDLAGDV
jgi:transposase